MARPGRALTGGKSAGKITSKGRRPTRDRIVAAAAELMFEGGVAGTTMEMVRAAARVSSSQIYHYFADKETLVRAVIEYQNETIVGGRNPCWPSWTPWRACGPGVTSWSSTSASYSAAGAAARSERSAASWPRSTRRPGWLSQAGSAGGRQESGRLPGHGRPRRAWPGCHARRLATTMLAALQGGLLISQVQRSTVPLEVALDTVIDHIGAQMVPAAS